MLKKSITISLLILWSIIMTGTSSNSASWNCSPDTWTATDALGRVVSTHDQVGSLRKDKFVGIFYFLWLGMHGNEGPFDVSKVLAKDPDAMQKPDSPLWGPKFKFHHWGEPLFGYYLSTDPWVYRKHAQMLSDAGVDVVIFDVTNQATYPDSYLTLCKTWEQVRREGNPTPQIAFLTPFWDPQKVVRKLYDDFYSKGLYHDLWFQWKGKPLILADPEKVDDDVKDFFTFRKPQADYFQGPTGPDQWGWLEVYPQHVFKNSKGEAEQMTVGVGQNANERLAAFNVPNTHGRSWHDGKKDNRPGAVNLGLNVTEQWNRALEVDPEFIFITGWNEWIALRLPEFNGVKLPVMFVDQYTQEYSRDIEPMKGGHGDDYYYQMVNYIRKFKGAQELPKAGPEKTINMDGNFSDWDDVSPEYLDTINDTEHRNHPGCGTIGQYINDTGRNDFVLMKVARDDRFIYFYAKTRQPVTPHTDPNWMMLFINTQGDTRKGWEGYDFIVNRTVPGKDTATLEHSTGGWNWEKVQEIHYKVKGCEMELAIPRTALGFGDLTNPIKFDFKWADNIQNPGDIMEFTVNGDAAPNGRFNYRFEE